MSIVYCILSLRLLCCKFLSCTKLRTFCGNIQNLKSWLCKTNAQCSNGLKLCFKLYNGLSCTGWGQNFKENQKCIIGSKKIVILLNRWILPIDGVALGSRLISMWRLSYIGGSMTIVFISAMAMVKISHLISATEFVSALDCARTFPDASLPKGKFQLISKINLTIESMMQFWFPSNLRMF